MTVQAKRQTTRHLVIAAVMAAMFMIAIEATIVSTAMPQIAAELGGLKLYSWVFSSFLLTQTATTVVWGKLSDLYGRKPILLVGIALFLVGSVFCGFSTSIPIMIVFRLVQGIGAGAIQPVGITVVGDLYAANERGKVQGYLASVWAISAVIGPLAGGLITHYVSWAWIFWINVPIGLLAAVGFWLFLHEGVVQGRRQIDVIGAALFTTAVAALMVALTETGSDATGTVLVAVVVFVVAAVLLVWQERRAPDPMIAFGLWGQRPIAAANAAALFSGMALIGLTTFLPMFVQGVLGRSALVAGFALTAVVAGWPLAATWSARNLQRFGVRQILLAGALLLPVGAIAFVALGRGSSPIQAGVGSFVMGFGMGLLSTASLVLIQDIVEWEQRGSATASNIFARNLGSTLGAAVLGAVLNYGLAHAEGGGVSEAALRRLLDATDATLPAVEPVRDALHHSLTLTFWAIMAMALLTVVVAWLVPAMTLRGAPQPVSAE